MIPCPDSPCSTPRGDENAYEEASVFLSAKQEDEVEQLHEGKENRKENHGPFAVGSFVEYKSRSSGHWILAKVEAYDEAADSYRLDVQPHARSDRVRRRQRRSGEKHHVAEKLGQESTPTLKSAREQKAVRDQERGCAHDEKHGTPLHGDAELMGQATPTGYPCQTAETGQQMDAFQDASALSLSPDFHAYGCESLSEEVQRLQHQVAQLQSDKIELQETLLQERQLKDQYFAELCICHEQLQRSRSTPR
jgi:hypothetical protein